MTLDSWLVFTLTATVLCFTPGPAVLLVVSTALSSGTLPGLQAAGGILAVNALYFLLSATGIGAILVASWELFFLVKWIGAAYLIYLGLRMIFAKAGRLPAGEEAPRGRRAAPFASGLITQGSNPKAIFFFSALVPQFIDPRGPVGVQVAILGVTTILLELGVLSLYVAACGRARRLVKRPGLSLALERAGGVLLIGAGAGLAAMRRGA